LIPTHIDRNTKSTSQFFGVFIMSKEQILDAIASMTVLELADLIKMIEEKFGVSAAAAAVAVAAPASAAAAPAAEEKTEFTVLLAATVRRRLRSLKWFALQPVLD